MQTISEALKSGGLDQLGPYLRRILELGQAASQNPNLSANTTVRKQVIKISGRVGLALLPPVSRVHQNSGFTLLTKDINLVYWIVQTLHGVSNPQNEGLTETVGEAIDIPVEVDGIIDDLLTALRDRVRGSSNLTSLLSLRS